MPAAARRHWEGVWSTRAPREVSWFEPAPKWSLELIAACGVDLDAAIIDVGAGASRLAAGLVEGGYEDVTVADISAAALEAGRAEAGAAEERITWIEADVLVHDFERSYDLWHDRALLHFMVDQAGRRAYADAVRRALAPGAYLVVATFGPEGPDRCSGLPVRRYGAEELLEVFGPGFELVDSRPVTHQTPSGVSQQLHYARLRRVSPR